MNIGYQRNNTVVHHLHPITLFLWIIGIIIGSLTVQDPLILLLIFFSMIPIALVGKITRSWWSFLQVALWLSVFIVAMNLLFSQYGNTLLFQVKIPMVATIRFSLESLVFALTMSLRLVCMISAFALLSLLINPDTLLHVFLRLHFPKKTILTTMIALRFMPVLLRDVETLQDSIQTRGYNLHPKGMLQKAKKRSALVIPLLSTALDRSIQTAEAMEARGFGSSRRMRLFTRMSTTWFDVCSAVCSVGLIGFMLWLWIGSVANFSFYPTLSSWSWTSQYLIILGIVVLFVVSPVLISPLKKVMDVDPVF